MIFVLYFKLTKIYIKFVNNLPTLKLTVVFNFYLHNIKYTIGWVIRPSKL